MSSIPVSFRNSKSNHLIVDLSGDDPLLCPYCAGDYLHHEDVVVRSRDHDDQDGIVITVHPGGEADVARCTTFAGRRNDLAIDFWCELCNGRFTLAIRQHKGQTFATLVDRSETSQSVREGRSAA